MSFSRRVSDGIEEERTQLIDTTSTFRTNYCEKFLMVMLVLVIMIGVSASIYLLIVEGKDPVPNSFTLVPQTEWLIRTRCKDTHQLQLPVQRILLLPTNTTECRSESECLKGLRNLQNDQVKRLNGTNIPYNFVLAGDNRIYEGRGWDCSSSDSNGVDIFTIALLGKYDDQSPTDKQVKVLEAFLEHAVMEKLVSNCYKILSRGSTTTYITQVAFDLESRRKKNMC
ncbi:peptidoglycan-recognition protein LF-like [Anoplophora glabripennis]|uniref:peptidoglycan-recognition protein LF-like n=1 Tax=Anoplophora glabripennis TaxID=217634 RepID=UPI00087574B4|nr:peptidoglycan-recognition protein LF-like [Anoplophora glabripennis]